MNAPLRQHACIDDSLIEKEARRILRRMCETDATLVVSDLMPRAAVLRCNKGQQPTRTAVVERKLAQAFALKEWIACVETGKIARYEITPLGRAALKRMIARQPPGAEPTLGQAEERNIFGDQHRDFTAGPQIAQARRPGADGAAPAREKPRQRYNLAESPLGVLSRRRDPKTGAAFLSAELVQAGERLREDFELAQMGARITQNWDKFMTAGCGGGLGAGDGGICEGPAAARKRVSDALADLGPGLGDILLRCCCFLEGLEAAEKRMGWSARSGKIVLRIALQQLAQHYATLSAERPRLIG
ncbi:DUF6456 domain-containing protein [Brevirhabdus sp.]|uniref:DUF6456 domain-containing protein n=1 Tax=Brevirhabdus sp. TaxID=2004514 RepID=UPI0040584313